MNKTLPFTFFQMHPNMILLEWQQEPSSGLLQELLFLKKNVKEHFNGISQITQGYCSLLIQWKDAITNLADIKNKLIFLYWSLDFTSIPEKSKHWNLPVCYDKSFAIDLELLSSKIKLSKDAVISIHTQSIYKVYFIGFLPGFLYLEGLNSRLFFPRKESPRMDTPKGAVAIGGKQTGIYPNQSPGGWNIIGNTPIPLFDPNKKNPCFAVPGDTVSFYPITIKEHQLILTNGNPLSYLKEKK
ncbi:allophanate hydrolase subunit 1 [Flavobacteriaceae bacterium]|nr:allophanate hydrolase subunit 1 [Flavobacteriaceae bacterium]MDC1542236.1 allophanate hydrolase subunit 1 [Flavobacteriaceae bacterium]